MKRTASIVWRLNHKGDDVSVILFDGREVYINAAGAFNVHVNGEVLQMGAFAKGKSTNTCALHPEVGTFVPPAVCPKCAMENKNGQ